MSAAALLAFASFSSASAQTEAVPGELIIKFKPKTSTVTRKALTARLGGQPRRRLQLIGADVITSNDGIDHEYAKKLLASGEAEYIEPNYIFRASATPNDPSFSQLWGMHNTGQGGGTADVDIDAPEAWDMSTGSTSVVVGVIDTGVNYLHPDLAANMWQNPGEVAGNGVDDDGNGVIDDVYGFNAITNGGNPMDDHAHGSHCAGTIAGVGNNGAGVAGVGWNIKIMALKFLNSSGSGSTSDAVEAIEYAVAQKQAGVNIRVLSNSWGGGGASAALSDAISAAENAGILFVAAAGNASSDNDASPTYPANYPQDNIISVAAVDKDGNLASFSNYGATTVDVAAPGVGILSTVLGSNYSSFSGTSMATPHVSGIAGLLLSYDPGLTLSALRARIVGTIKPRSTLSGVVSTGGIASAKNALSNTIAPAPPPSAQTRYSKSQIPASAENTLGTKILNVDDGYAEVALPFPIRFYLSEFSRLAVSANGRIIPLSASDGMPFNLDYSNQLYPGINVLSDDLFPSPVSSEGGVWARVEGDHVTVTWVSVPYVLRASGNAASELRFQAKLFADGKIEMHYIDNDSGQGATSNGASASVGLAPTAGVTGERLLVSHNASSPSLLGSGQALRYVIDSAGNNDFDGDGVSDFITYRPSKGRWFVLQSSTAFDPAQIRSFKLGGPKETPLVGDFDGDGKIDFATYLPGKQGKWSLLKSSRFYTRAAKVTWGEKGDVPVVADYDGDGSSDIAVYSPKKGKFLVLRAELGFNWKGALKSRAKANISIKSGSRGWSPVTGDFTGQGRDSFVTVSNNPRFWVVKDNLGQEQMNLPWGEAGDKVMGCDMDSNGIADRVAVRANGGSLTWLTATDSGGAQTDTFGTAGTMPSCDKDFDGDGENDLATFSRDTGEWKIRESSTSVERTYSLGAPGDIGL